MEEEIKEPEVKEPRVIKLSKEMAKKRKQEHVYIGKDPLKVTKYSQE